MLGLIHSVRTVRAGEEFEPRKILVSGVNDTPKCPIGKGQEPKSTSLFNALQFQPGIKNSSGIRDVKNSSHAEYFSAAGMSEIEAWKWKPTEAI
jgi:hypothetical protein